MPSKKPRAYVSRAAGKILTPEQVLGILNSTESIRNTANRFCVSPQTVSNVQLGIHHSDIHPEIPRRAPYKRLTTCITCGHWNAIGCSFGFPEVTEGPSKFANYCSVYTSSQPVQELQTA